MTLKMSEKLAVTLLGLSIVQVVAATVALYYGLTLYFLVEVEVLSYASINYQLLPILIIGLATLAASNRFDFIRISLMFSVVGCWLVSAWIPRKSKCKVHACSCG